MSFIYIPPPPAAGFTAGYYFVSNSAFPIRSSTGGTTIEHFSSQGISNPAVTLDNASGEFTFDVGSYLLTCTGTFSGTEGNDYVVVPSWSGATITQYPTVGTQTSGAYKAGNAGVDCNFTFDRVLNVTDSSTVVTFGFLGPDTDGLLESFQLWIATLPAS